MPPAPRLPLPTLGTIAAGLARSPLWHGLADPTEDRRSAVRIVRTECYEAWVLGWLPGHSVDLHDHGGSDAAFAVVEGALVEVSAAPGGPLERTVLPAGAVHHVPADRRHDVLNLGATPATSVHVYSPPLTSMAFYDPIDGSPVRVEAVEDDGAVWPDAAAHRWLHPARSG
jgi:mannose-6-phosphate isomerase-like protein (cupin superfamily)